ncbi:MAG: NTP transferase domain-containing protein [Bacteroidales bacterium]|nr:NTP transferase domain-containing protein [Bacteroidales bacterium]
MKITGFIFAAGLGTRLYPLTASKPKALVRYQGKPLLAYVLEKMVEAGIHDVVVNVHHFADQIIDYLRDYQGDVDIRISDERVYLRDTAGGLKYAQPLLGDADVMVLYNVDILSTINLRSMIEHHLSSKADVTLAVRERSTARYLMFDPVDLRLKGWKNVKTGELILPDNYSPTIDLAFSGIHVINADVINVIPSVEKSSLVPFYVHNINNLSIKGFWHQQDQWFDVGKYEEFYNLLT